MAAHRAAGAQISVRATMSVQNIKHVGIIGGGAWGTALAQTLALSGKDITLWAYESETVREINDHHINRTYLPGVALEQSIGATGDFAKLENCDVILIVAPTQAVRTVTTQCAPHIPDDCPVVICAKGIEQATGKMLSDVVTETLPHARHAILSGPSFAADVARGLPAAVTLASRNEQLGQSLAKELGYRQFRIYWSDDVTGVQLGGAIKNVLAIAAGVVDGKDLGASAHAALVARGFAEMARLGIAMGAKPETLTGLAGLGDLILTCGSANSRNMSLGRALGKGQSLADTLGARSSVTEGVFTAQAVAALARKHGVDMPICDSIHKITSGTITVNDAIASLLDRPMKAED